MSTFGLRCHGLTGYKDLVTLYDSLNYSREGARELMGRELIRGEADVWSRRWKSSRVQVNLHIGTVANLHSSALTAATMEEECLSGTNLSCLLTSSYSSSFLPSSLPAPLLWSRPSPSAHSTASYSPWRPSAKSTGTSISGLLARSGPSIALLGAGWRVIMLRSGVIALWSLLLLVGVCQGLRFYYTRLLSRASQGDRSKLQNRYHLLEVRCRDRGASSRHEVGDIPVIVRSDPLFGFTGQGIWPCAEAMGDVTMGSEKCVFGILAAAPYQCNRVVGKSSGVGLFASRRPTRDTSGRSRGVGGIVAR